MGLFRINRPETSASKDQSIVKATRKPKSNTDDIISQVADKVKNALSKYGSHYELVSTPERMTQWVDNVLSIKSNIVGIDTET